MSDIEKLRGQIDRLDDELLRLLNERARLAQQVGELKNGAPAYRPEREADILRRLSDKNRGPLSAQRLAGVFREVISACRALEQPLRVTYLGPEGTFSEQALRKHFGAAVEALACASVEEAFRRCESGAAQFTVVPAENSTEGVVGRTLDLLLATPLLICGEVELRVQQNLLGGSELKAIRRVYSHAQSLAQCNGWLAQNLPGVERVPVTSNAEAAQRAAREAAAAAIAGEAAAERYGLAVLARGIEDAADNTTRFLVLGNVTAGPTGRDRTSLVLSAENKPGAVHGLLTPLARHRVSMTRIESRPSRLATRSGLWEYVFFIDVEGHQRDAALAQALAELKEAAPFLKILGSYPIAMN
ncbi:MAG TPA: prephenate dehydratase [Burkholderiales bacterium]|jgi:chorismate mutase/prephenate dehydratase|nr:prephenate dehydratase [Burkholderiales bacterium]